MPVTPTRADGSNRDLASCAERAMALVGGVARSWVGRDAGQFRDPSSLKAVTGRAKPLQREFPGRLGAELGLVRRGAHALRQHAPRRPGTRRTGAQPGWSPCRSRRSRDPASEGGPHPVSAQSPRWQRGLALGSTAVVQRLPAERARRLDVVRHVVDEQHLTGREAEAP